VRVVVQKYGITIVIYSYTDHPARTLVFDNNLAYPHLYGWGKKVSNKVLLTRVAGLTRNDSKFDAPVFLPSNALRFLHKERSEALQRGATQRRKM
jgi:hypothetical protein